MPKIFQFAQKKHANIKAGDTVYWFHSPVIHFAGWKVLKISGGNALVALNLPEVGAFAKDVRIRCTVDVRVLAKGKFVPEKPAGALMKKLKL